MTINDLARILRNAHAAGENDGEQKRNVILFGIRYADELEGISPRRLKELTGLSEYGPEISVAKQLSECVGLTNAAIRILDEANQT